MTATSNQDGLDMPVGTRLTLRGYHHGGPTGKSTVEFQGWTYRSGQPACMDFWLVGTTDVRMSLPARKLTRDGDTLTYHP